MCNSFRGDYLSDVTVMRNLCCKIWGEGTLYVQHMVSMVTLLVSVQYYIIENQFHFHTCTGAQQTN